MRLRAPHSSFPTGDARRVATLDPSAASAGASRTAIPRAALGLFIALSLAACTVPGPLSKAQTDRLTSPDLAVRSSQLTQAHATTRRRMSFIRWWPVMAWWPRNRRWPARWVSTS